MPESPSPPRLSRLPEDQDLRRTVKRELRKRMRSLRKATPQDACDERSARIIARLLELDALRSARSVALFWPIEARHEVDLRPLDEALRERGVRIAYPALVPEPVAEGAPRRMTFHFVDDPRTLVERGFGFAEPREDAPVVAADLGDLDVVVVPALALDPSGQRIGYGGGYYDQALAATNVVKVGVIYDFQLLLEVPVTERDIAVDWIVTDRRVLQAGVSEVPST
jgi:5-formyltetrahydrofolate cyclo-ligase